MSNKKQTAVWQLKEKIEQLRSDYWERLCPLSAFEEAAGNLASQIATIDIILKEIELKLELEKQQIIDAYVDGSYTIKQAITKQMRIDNAEQYYKETYGEQ